MHLLGGLLCSQFGLMSTNNYYRLLPVFLTIIFFNKLNECSNFYISRFFFLFAVQYVQKRYQQRIQTCLLDENNYVYSRVNTRIKSTGIYSQWRCVNRKTCTCPATCSTLNDRLRSFNGIHNHAPTFCEKTMILVDDSI